MKYFKTKCVKWPGYIDKAGYGKATVRGKSKSAHRLIWEILKGSIPPGLVIDHLCFNRACVNIRHMEVTTISKNSERGQVRVKKKYQTNGIQ